MTLDKLLPFLFLYCCKAGTRFLPASLCQCANRGLHRCQVFRAVPSTQGALCRSHYQRGHGSSVFTAPRGEKERATQTTW